MTAITLSETLGAKAPTILTTMQGIGALIDLRPESTALAQNGLQVQKLINKIAEDLEVADAIEIDSPEMLAEAEGIAGRLAAVCGDSGAMETERKALVSPFNDLVKKVNAGYSEAREHIQQVLAGTNGRGGLKGKILAYNAEQQRLAEVRAAEERQRREHEAQAAAAREAEAQAEANRLLQQAQAAQDAGSEITAAALASEASVKVDAARSEAQEAVTALHTRVAAAPVAQAKGVRGKWKATITNKAELIKHVAKLLEKGDTSLLDALDANASVLNQLASVQKAGMALPGVRPEFEQSLAVRKAVLA